MPEQNQQLAIDLASQTGQQAIAEAISNLSFDKETSLFRLTITLSSEAWTGNDPYTQIITIPGVILTKDSKVDVQPNETVLSNLISDGVTALWIENNNGIIIAKSLGAAPQTSLNLQCTISDTQVSSTNLGSKTITENGTYYAMDDNLDGYSEVVVNVESDINILSGRDLPTSVIGNDGDIYLHFLEGVDIFGRPTSNNLEDATIASTSTYSSYSPFKAFGDNDGWGANSSNGTLTYSFTSKTFCPKSLSFIDYFAVIGGQLKANTFTFEGSNDGINWDTLYTKSDQATTQDVVKTVSIETQNSYSKFRFVVNGGSDWAGIKRIVCYDNSSTQTVTNVFLKTNGTWHELIGSDIDDMNI